VDSTNQPLLVLGGLNHGLLTLHGFSLGLVECVFGLFLLSLKLFLQVLDLVQGIVPLGLRLGGDMRGILLLGVHLGNKLRDIHNNII
jgi:hypothetical protein